MSSSLPVDDNMVTIKALLQSAISIPENKRTLFYKTGIDQYAAHDQFLGITAPSLRKIVRNFWQLPLTDLQHFLYSVFNEERLLALLILVHQYQVANPNQQKILYQFYWQHLPQVNNWNLVDASAHLIIGKYLLARSKKPLWQLAKSKSLWKRRVAIVATWYFIQQQQLQTTFDIAKLLLNDTEDLIHKAVGWMLREAGKRDCKQLISFLDHHASYMPRTMLRYAIEKFFESERKVYLNYR